MKLCRNSYFSSVFLISTIFVLFSIPTSAQIASSSSVWLNSSKTDPKESGLDSGRYKINHRILPAQPVSQNVENTVEAPKVKVPVVKKSSTQQPVVPIINQPTQSAQPLVINVERPTPQKLPFITGELSTFALYHDSQSRYWYRSYSTDSLGLKLSSKLWVSEAWGAQFSYARSYGGQITDTSDRLTYTALQMQWFSGLLKFRTVYSGANGTSSLEYGLGYSDFIQTPDGASLNRPSLRSSGIVASIDSVISQDPMKSLVLGLQFRPALVHREGGQDSFSSGKPDESTSVSLNAGQSFRVQKQRRFFYRVSLSYEKNRFSGIASKIDPLTGQTPTGVSVTQTTSMFELGLSWSQ